MISTFIFKFLIIFLFIRFPYNNQFYCLNIQNETLKGNFQNDVNDPNLILKHPGRDDILYLTPYIEDGRLEDAIEASEVKNLPGIGHKLKSYSGFLTVNKKFNSNLFFWFFLPLSKDSYAPVLFWLSGGPGDPSIRGMFTQNGPIQVDEDGNPSLRNSTWNQEFAVLYIDNPVGTGFSFTDNDKGYARDQIDASRDLYEGLRQFFTIFSEYRRNPLYLTGYGYACKFQAVLANRIRENNELSKTKVKMNLQGIAIGGGYCDPRHQYDFADFLYQVGLIEEKEWTYFWLRQLVYIKYIIEHQWVKAQDVINDLYYGVTFGREQGSYFANVSAYIALDNLRLIEDSPELDNFVPYLDNRRTRNAIHVGRRSFDSPATKVAQFMYGDIAKSVQPEIEKLLNANVRTMFYNGNMDLVTPPPLMENVIRNLKWTGSRRYLDSTKQIYRCSHEDEQTTNSTVAGYVRQADNLQWVIMRNAGHYASLDQPEVTLDLITRFVKRINFNSAIEKVQSSKSFN